MTFEPKRHMDLVDRLRGIYAIDVTRDGAGLLNGSRWSVHHARDMQDNWFQIPIQAEAAKEIERLRNLVENLGGNPYEDTK